MNLASIVDKHEASRPAIISRGRVTNYGELRQQIEAFRGSLTAAGVAPGDRVALMCGNGRWFVVAYLATVGAGAIAVPLNPLSPAPELEAELAIVDPKVVLVEASGIPSFSAVDRSKLPGLSLVIVTDAMSVTNVSGSTNGKNNDVRTFDAMLTGTPTRWVEMPENAPAVLIFTSGTAGSPKAA
ncbi:MAG: AMP-binding protein, partial [Ilumatobacteraceae bacterium]